MPTPIPIPIPIIESPRLILRPFTQADFEPMAAFFTSPVSSTYGGSCDRAEVFGVRFQLIDG